jgi:hypothetical protein
VTFHPISCTIQPERIVEKSNENIQKSPPPLTPPQRIGEELGKDRYENVSNGGHDKVSGSV